MHLALTHLFHEICHCSLCLLQELSGVTQLQAVKDSYVPVIKFQVICLDAGSPALLKSYAFTAASVQMTFCIFCFFEPET